MNANVELLTLFLSWLDKNYLIALLFAFVLIPYAAFGVVVYSLSVLKKKK